MHLHRYFAAALAAALSLATALPAPCQDADDTPHRDWVFNGRGRKTNPVSFADMGENDWLYPINLNNRWGLMNQRGDVVVYPRFDWADYNYEGFTRVVLDGKTGFLYGDIQVTNNPNEYYIPPKYDYADRFCNDVAVVQHNGKWGMIDKSGALLLPLKFDGVLRMQEGFAGVQLGERCGFVNRAGKLKIPLDYARVRSFHNGLAAVQQANGLWGYIDKRGKLVWLDRSGRVQALGDFHGQLARYAIRDGAGNLRWGFMSRTFKPKIDPVYESARDLHEGMAAVKHQGKWGYLYTSGRWAIKPQFEDADDFDDADATIQDDDNKRRDSDEPATAGLYAMVKLDGRWGYINRTAKAGLVPQFEQAEPFFRGLARVGRDDSFAYVGETGQVRFDPRVALEFGLADRTAKGQARAKLDREAGRRVDLRVRPPAPHEAWGHSYVSEYLYHETLPAPTAAD